MQPRKERRRVFDDVAAQLRKYLQKSCRAGDRIEPIRSLAVSLGVSHWSLRAAQALLAREGLLEIRHGSGVYVTGRIQKPQIGICTPFDVLQPRASSFQTQVPRLLRDYLDRQGYCAEIYVGKSAPGEMDPPANCPRFLADVEAGRLDGIAILNAPDLASWVEWIQALAIPAVGVHTPYAVGIPHRSMVTTGVRSLFDQGCRRIGLLSWSGPGLPAAFRDALAGLSLSVHPEWIRGDLHPMLSGAGWEEFREIWTAREEKPDGVLACDDVLCDEAATAIHELGIRMPETLRLAMFSNKGSSARYPFPVTRIEVDPALYAERLGEMLVRRMRGQKVPPPSPTLPFDVIEATGMPRAIGSSRIESADGRCVTSQSLP